MSLSDLPNSMLRKKTNAKEPIEKVMKKEKLKDTYTCTYPTSAGALAGKLGQDAKSKEAFTSPSTSFSYYCSLCGANVILSNSMLELMPRRRTDEAIICMTSRISFKNFMKRDKLILIKRGINKYEKQYTYTCQDCSALIAYQASDFDDQDSTSELKQRSNKIFSQNKRRIVYILNDAVVCDPKQSSVFIEIEKLKETQSKKTITTHIKFKRREVGKHEKEKIV